MKKFHISLLLLTALFLLTGKAQLSAQETPIDSMDLPWVGTLLGDGIVFHVDEVTRKVLVVSFTEAPVNAKNFYGTYGECGQLITGASYGENGKKNTAAIIVSQVIRPEIIPQNNPYPNPGDYRDNSRKPDTARRAAHWCTELKGGEEWFLPSREQLKKLYEAKSTVNQTLTSMEGTPLGNGYYWSSTQLDAYNAWYVFFDNGEVAASTKSNAGSVRAIAEYSYSSAPVVDDEEEENGSYDGIYEKDDDDDDDVTGVGKKNRLNVNLYPTPTKGTLNIEGLTGRVRVDVYSAFGVLFMSRMYEGDGLFSIDLSAMPKGTLFVRLTCDGKSTTKQIVKQ